MWKSGDCRGRGSLGTHEECAHTRAQCRASIQMPATAEGIGGRQHRSTERSPNREWVTRVPNCCLLNPDSLSPYTREATS